MNSHETKALQAFDKAIAELQKGKEALLANIPLSSRVKKNDWVIDKRTNSHSQFVNIKENVVGLIRYTGDRILSVDTFNENFALATPEQVESHLRFLNKKDLWYVGRIEDASGIFNSIPTDSMREHIQKLCKESRKEPQVPDFYMITIEGKNGSVVRHETFEIAAAEASRLAKKCNHRAHIMGVVAIVEPVQVQQPVTEYKLIKK